jgi:hypothetical protein
MITGSKDAFVAWKLQKNSIGKLMDFGFNFGKFRDDFRLIWCARFREITECFSGISHFRQNSTSKLPPEARENTLEVCELPRVVELSFSISCQGESRFVPKTVTHFIAQLGASLSLLR